MKKVFQIIKQVLLGIWQLPQLIVGAVLLLWYRSSIFETAQREYATLFGATRMSGGITLGPIIILSTHCYNSENTKNHEYGHAKQSLILGPLYLLIIGIPSIIWAMFYKYDASNPNGYYKFYTEKWADKLGGVIRS